MGGRFNLLLLGVVVAGLALGVALAALKPLSGVGGQPTSRAQAAGAPGSRAIEAARSQAGGVSGAGPAGTAGTQPSGTPGAMPTGTPGGVPAGTIGAAPAGTPGAGAILRRAEGQGQLGADARSRPLAGSVVSVGDGTLLVATQQGEIRVKLADATIQKTVEGSVEDLKPGSRVIVAARQEADGSLTAGSIQIAPAGDAAEQPRTERMPPGR